MDTSLLNKPTKFGEKLSGAAE